MCRDVRRKVAAVLGGKDSHRSPARNHKTILLRDARREPAIGGRGPRFPGMFLPSESQERTILRGGCRECSGVILYSQNRDSQNRVTPASVQGHVVPASRTFPDMISRVILVAQPQ